MTKNINKRILFDATHLNISIPNGGSFCTKAYLEALLVLFPGQIDVLHPLEAHIRDPRYNTIDVPRVGKFQYAIDLIFGRFYRGAKYIINIIHDNPELYQMVFINRGHAAGYLAKRLHNMSIKTIVLHHNFETEYQMATRSRISLNGRTAFFVRYWEKKGYQRADVNLFLTQYDKNIFEHTYGAHPNNYITGVFEPSMERLDILSECHSKSAVITCALDQRQNVNSILCFLHQYLPVFHQLLPDWELHIMGREPFKEIIDVANQYPYVTLIPSPENIREIAAMSSIYLCPMDGGGGLKLRIMDGLRVGQPILLHKRSARGYEEFIGESFFVTYTDLESFSISLKKILNLIQSSQYSRKAIQQRYYDLFGLQAGVKKLESIINNL